MVLEPGRRKRGARGGHVSEGWAEGLWPDGHGAVLGALDRGAGTLSLGGRARTEFKELPWLDGLELSGSEGQ